MSEGISRREAIVRTAKAAGGLLAASAVGTLAFDRGGLDVERRTGKRVVRDFGVPREGNLDLVVARHGEPEALVRKAIEAMGGMRRFVSRGDKVVIKPNIGWDRIPLQAANTNPVVVATLVELCFDAGAARVTVTDASCNDPRRCFQRSGIWRAAHARGATVVLPVERAFRKMRLGGEVLDEWPVYTTLIEADKVINAPIAKHHNLAGYTAAMKNWYGCLGGRRNRLHQSIDVSVADLATFMRPTLTVVDAVRVLVRNGPQGGSLDDTRRMDTLIASVDQVAADALGCTLIGRTKDDLPYLRLAEGRGIGTTDLTRLRMREIEVA
ncbi:MAG: DUF362 domain-containing protein [Deltaproteobacteria bacterium]|nr:DUF362 domain-containing protein [Deltaproteobacteria bacterium]